MQSPPAAVYPVRHVRTHPSQSATQHPARGPFVAFLALVGAAIGALTVRAVGHDHRPPRFFRWHRVRVVPEGRRHRPGGQPLDPAEQYNSGCTTSSRACASPAVCPSRAVYVVDDPAPNAFATGRDHAAVAVTTGPPGSQPGRALRKGARPRAVAHPQLRHPRQHPGRHPRRRRRPAHRHGHPADVVERRPRPPRRRPLRRQQPARIPRVRAVESPDRPEPCRPR